jgi:hypothetical protein
MMRDSHKMTSYRSWYANGMVVFDDKGSNDLDGTVPPRK